MSKFSDLVPERIRALGGYVPGKPIKQAEAECGVKCTKMASNENPFGPSPRAIEAMQAALHDVHLYPDNEVTELKNRLAELNGLKPEQVMITAGSTSFLDIIARTLLAPGLNAITCERSFIVYPIVTRATGAEFRRVPLKNDAFDLDAIADAIDENTRIVFLANPNNPTGTMVTAEEIDRFLDRVPAHVCVVLDEAYYDFAAYFAGERLVNYSHSVEYVRQERNVVVLRTFSKAHGLASLRVGYGYGPAELMGYFARVRTAFMVSSIGEAAALAALDDVAHLQRAIENNAKGVEWIMSQLEAMNYKPIRPWGNFIYCDIGEDAAAFAKRLQGEGIIVRPLTGAWGAPTAIRITVGTREQNERFLAAVKKVASGAMVSS